MKDHGVDRWSSPVGYMTQESDGDYVTYEALEEAMNRIAELEEAFDTLHDHLDDMIDVERINVLTMSDVIMDKRLKAMRGRHKEEK